MEEVQLQNPEQGSGNGSTVAVPPGEPEVAPAGPSMPRPPAAPLAQPPRATTTQGTPGRCPSCGGDQPAAGTNAASPVYVIGQIEPRYPSLGVEKEARQAVARAGASKDTDREVMAKILRDPNNKYLVRQLGWVLLVQGIEHYLLVPSHGDFQPLVEAYRERPEPGDLSVVIGRRGPMAPPTMCNGLLVPILIFDQIYVFDRKSLLDSIPKQKEKDTERFTKAAGEILEHIIGQIDNAGATDRDRALNYLAVRYERIYSLAAEQFEHNASLESIRVLPSPLSGPRKIADVVIAFRDRSTDVLSRFFVRVDLTELYPFLVTKMGPYYER